MTNMEKWLDEQVAEFIEHESAPLEAPATPPHNLREIGRATAGTWLHADGVRMMEVGQENAYFVDEFDNRYYVKYED